MKKSFNVIEICVTAIVIFTSPTASQQGGFLTPPTECNGAIGLHIDECRKSDDPKNSTLTFCNSNITYSVCMKKRKIAKIINEPFTSYLIPGKISYFFGQHKYIALFWGKLLQI